MRAFGRKESSDGTVSTLVNVKRLGVNRNNTFASSARTFQKQRNLDGPVVDRFSVHLVAILIFSMARRFSRKRHVPRVAPSPSHRVRKTRVPYIKLERYCAEFWPRPGQWKADERFYELCNIRRSFVPDARVVRDPSFIFVNVFDIFHRHCPSDGRALFGNAAGRERRRSSVTGTNEHRVMDPAPLLVSVDERRALV